MLSVNKYIPVDVQLKDDHMPDGSGSFFKTKHYLKKTPNLLDGYNP
jgi:hypothetical protein